jgi:hypothetical protein
VKTALHNRIGQLERTTELALRPGDPLAALLTGIDTATLEGSAPEALHHALLAQVRQLHQRTLGILRRAEHAGRVETALKAIREARSNVELLAQLTGQLDSAPASVGVQAVIVLPAPELAGIEPRATIDIDVR